MNVKKTKSSKKIVLKITMSMTQINPFLIRDDVGVRCVLNHLDGMAN